MKIRTVGALAALGMLLTSYSVWSLTADRARPNSGWVHHAGTDRGDDRGRPNEASLASFTANGTLGMDARLGHAKLPAGETQETFVLVNVRADDKVSGRPTSRHLAIVVDRSGSMRGKRMQNAIAAAQGAVRRLADGDIVSVVDYAGFGHVLVEPTELGPDTREAVSARIGRLAADGDTCISCGLDTALDLLRRRTGGVDRVLLVSDGEATTGVRDIEGMRRVADRVRATGATVTTIGVDVDYNERMMTAIAEQTNGFQIALLLHDKRARLCDSGVPSPVREAEDQDDAHQPWAEDRDQSDCQDGTDMRFEIARETKKKKKNKKQ